jgi:hypothetical protein
VTVTITGTGAGTTVTHAATVSLTVKWGTVNRRRALRH